MLPREFLGAFGRVVPRQHTLALGESVTIAAHPDRYLLVFWSTNVSIQVVPSLGDITGLQAWEWVALSNPVAFTHVEHGSLVNLGFTIGPAPGATSLLVLEGLMTPLGIAKRKGVADASVTQAIRNDSRRSVSKRARR